MYLVIKAALSEPLLAEKEKETTAEPAYILQSIHIIATSAVAEKIRRSQTNFAFAR